MISRLKKYCVSWDRHDKNLKQVNLLQKYDVLRSEHLSKTLPILNCNQRSIL